MKKLLIFIICIMLALAFNGCSSNPTRKPPNSPPSVEQPGTSPETPPEEPSQPTVYELEFGKDYVFDGVVFDRKASVSLANVNEYLTFIGLSAVSSISEFESLLLSNLTGPYSVLFDKISFTEDSATLSNEQHQGTMGYTILDGEITLSEESDISMRFDSSTGKVYHYITILDGYEIRYNYKVNK